MSRHEKTLEAMERNQEGWRYEQVAVMLRAFGFVVRSREGSHRLWSHAYGPTVLLVDKGHGTVRGYQVEQATAAVRQSLEEP
jgi:hypothetical protein